MVFEMVIERIMRYMAEENCGVEVAVREVYDDLTDVELSSVEHFLDRTDATVSLDGLSFAGRVTIDEARNLLYEEFVVRALSAEVSSLICR
jgi:hypothetical protein